MVKMQPTRALKRLIREVLDSTPVEGFLRDMELVRTFPGKALDRMRASRAHQENEKRFKDLREIREREARRLAQIRPYKATR